MGGTLDDPVRRDRMRVNLVRRDGRSCHWCGDKMDWPSHPPKKMDMTFEHITRARNGGKSTVSNLKLAHFICNMERD